MDPMIRPARADDLGAIESIVREAYGHYRERLGKEPGPMLDDYRAHIGEERIHVLEENGLLYGLVVLVREAETMLLDNVAVRPDAQGRGYGRQLIDFAEAEAMRFGYSSIRLYTNVAMTENLSLFFASALSKRTEAKKRASRESTCRKHYCGLGHLDLPPALEATGGKGTVTVRC